MSFNKKNIRLQILPFAKVHNLSVSVSIPYNCSDHALDELMINNPGCHTKDSDKCVIYSGSEEASVAYALFELVREKLMGSPLEISRCKVDHVECQAHNGNLVIAWNTQGNQSSLRKTIGVVLKCLQPNALFSRYSDNLKLLGGKPNRECFNHCANKMIDAIEKNIHFIAVGKIKLKNTADKQMMQKSFDTACKKYVKSSKSKDVHAPEKHSEYQTSYSKLSCDDGSSAIVVGEYIRANSNGMGVKICGKYVYVYSNSWGSKRDSLKDKSRISSYVSAKYSKLGDFAGLYLAYMANSQALGIALSISKLEKINPKQAIEKNI